MAREMVQKEFMISLVNEFPFLCLVMFAVHFVCVALFILESIF